MTVIETNYIQAGLPTMESYFNNVMGEYGISGEELASVLECPVDQLYELLIGAREVTLEDITVLEKTYTNASYQAFLVTCQMTRILQVERA